MLRGMRLPLLYGKIAKSDKRNPRRAMFTEHATTWLGEASNSTNMSDKLINNNQLLTKQTTTT